MRESIITYTGEEHDIDLSKVENCGFGIEENSYYLHFKMPLDSYVHLSVTYDEMLRVASDYINHLKETNR